MEPYVLNKKSFIIPPTPVRFNSLEDAQRTMHSFSITFDDIIRSIQPLQTNDPIGSDSLPYVVGYPDTVYMGIVVSGLSATFPAMKIVFPNITYNKPPTTITLPYQGGKYNSSQAGAFRLWVRESDGSYFLDEPYDMWNEFHYYENDLYLCNIGSWPVGDANVGIWWIYREADSREIVPRKRKVQLWQDRLINDYLIKPKDYDWGAGGLVLRYQDVVETSEGLLYLCMSPGTLPAEEPPKPGMFQPGEVYGYSGFGDFVWGGATIRYIGRQKYAGYWKQGLFGGISIFSTDCTNWLLRCPRDIWEPVKDYLWMGIKVLIENTVTQRMDNHTYEEYMKVTGTYRWDGWIWEALNAGTTGASEFPFLDYELEQGTTNATTFVIGSGAGEWTVFGGGWTTDGSTLVHAGFESYIEYNDAFDPSSEYEMTVWVESIGGSSYAKLYMDDSEGGIYDYGWSGYLIDRAGQYHTREITTPAGTPKLRIYAVGDIEIDDVRVYKAPIFYNTTKTGDGTIDWICIGRAGFQKSPTVTCLFMDMDNLMEHTTYTDAQDALPFGLTVNTNVMRELGILPDEFYYESSPHRDYWNNPISWFTFVGGVVYSTLIMNFHAPSGTLNWGSFGNLSSNGQQLFYPFNLFEDSCGTYASLDAMAKLCTDPRAGVALSSEQYYRAWAECAMSGLMKYWNSAEGCFDYYIWGETESLTGIDYDNIPAHTFYAHGQAQYTPVAYSIPLGQDYIKKAMDHAEAFWPEWWRHREEVSPYLCGFEHVASCMADRTDERKNDIIQMIEHEGLNQPPTNLDSPMFINYVQYMYLKTRNPIQSLSYPLQSLGEIKEISIQIVPGTEQCAIGDGQAYFTIPGELNGKRLVSVLQSVVTPGVTGTQDIQLYKRNNLWQVGGYWSYTSHFSISNPSGTTFRYTYLGTGSDPEITDSDSCLRAGDVLVIISSNFNATNCGTFTLLAVGTDWFEVDNAAGVVEADEILGGSIMATRFREMLSTVNSLDSGEYDTRQPTTRELVNPDNSIAYGYDLLRVDIKTVHTTPAYGLVVNMRFL